MRRVAVLLLVLASACGSSEPAPTADGSRPSSVQNEGTPMSSPTAPASKGKPTGPVTPIASASPTSRAAAVRAALSQACVRAGADAQTLTVSALQAGEVAGFSTQYSDGSNELTNKSYTQGFGSGKANAAGVYTTTWTVPAHAPRGPATVLVIYASGSQPIRVSFNVVLATEAC